MTLNRVHQDFLRNVKFFPNEYQKILTASLDKTSKVIDIREKKETMVIDNEMEIEDICFLEENQVSYACGKFLKIWDLRNTEKPLHNMYIANKAITSLNYVQNRLITTSYDNHMKVFSQKDNYKIVNQIKFDEPVISFAVDKNMSNYGIAFQNRKFEVYRKNELVEEKVENPREKYSEYEKQLMLKLHMGVGNRDQTSYKFYNRGVYEKVTDYTVKINKPLKVKR